MKLKVHFENSGYTIEEFCDKLEKLIQSGKAFIVSSVDDIKNDKVNFDNIIGAIKEYVVSSSNVIVDVSISSAYASGTIFSKLKNKKLGLYPIVNDSGSKNTLMGFYVAK